MQFKLLLAFLPLLKVATAIPKDGYKVPDDLAPGFYRVEFHANGTSTLATIDVNAIPDAAADAAEKRSLPGTVAPRAMLNKRVQWGNTGRIMREQGEYNSMTAAWGRWLAAGNAVYGWQISFFKTDHLILACCNYRDPKPLPGNAVDVFNAILDQQYGAWTTGWVHFQDIYGDLSFWRDWRGIQICGNLNGGIVGK